MADIKEQVSLLSLLAPRSVAVLGASDNPIKAGGRPIDYMQRHGYAGRIYPVNPKRAEIQGLAAYPDLATLMTTTSGESGSAARSG